MSAIKAGTPVNQDCLLIIKNIADVRGITQEQIKAVFKQYGLGRIIKYEERNEIVIEFINQEDLELLDMEFDDGKVEGLGPNAYYDDQNAADPEQFLRKYEEKLRLSAPENTENKGKEEEKSEVSESTVELSKLKEQQ